MSPKRGLMQLVVELSLNPLYNQDRVLCDYYLLPFTDEIFR